MASRTLLVLDFLPLSLVSLLCMYYVVFFLACKYWQVSGPLLYLHSFQRDTQCHGLNIICKLMPSTFIFPTWTAPLSPKLIYPTAYLPSPLKWTNIYFYFVCDNYIIITAINTATFIALYIISCRCGNGKMSRSGNLNPRC